MWLGAFFVHLWFKLAHAQLVPKLVTGYPKVLKQPLQSQIRVEIT